MAHPLLLRAKTEGTPLVDDDRFTFVWQGKEPAVLVGDFPGCDTDHPIPLKKVAPALWTYTWQAPRDTYLEYVFYLGDERVLDPFNPRTTPTGLGDRNNFMYGPEASPTPLMRAAQAVPRGSVTRHVISTEKLIAGTQRQVWLYQPPTADPSPLLLVYDGSEYLRRVRLPTLIDNLIAQGRVRPVALAMVANGGKSRLLEYGCSELMLWFVRQQVLPLAEAHLRLLDLQSGMHGVLGASLGGLMALYSALRAPEIFGSVLSQSGSFGVPGHEFVTTELVEYTPRLGTRIWMDVGQLEWLLESNRNMHALLQRRGYEVTYREYAGAHNYPSWRDDVWRGLETLFGRG